MRASCLLTAALALLPPAFPPAAAAGSTASAVRDAGAARHARTVRADATARAATTDAAARTAGSARTAGTVPATGTVQTTAAACRVPGLAVTAPYATVAGRYRAGAVSLFRDARPAGTLAQGRAGIAGEPGRGAAFGSAVVTGDFDGDGRDDLAVGVPGEGLDRFQDGPMYGDGAVHVLYGGPRGPRASGGEFWTLDARGVRGRARSTDRLGSALAAGNLNGDGDAELAAGAPGAGRVLVLAGTRTGGLTARHHALLAGRAGRPGDLFGSSVAVTPDGLAVRRPGAR
nr:FG-GAP repeat protein [Sphaerisporangium rufum]